MTLQNPTREEQTDFWKNCTKLSAKNISSQFKEIVDFFDLNYLAIRNIASKTDHKYGFEELSSNYKPSEIKERIWEMPRIYPTENERPGL